MPFPQNIIHFIFIPSINLSAQFFFSPIWRISQVFFSCKNGTSCIRGAFQTNTRERKCRTSGRLVDFQAAVLVQSRGESQIDDLQTCTLQPTATAEPCSLCQPASAPDASRAEERVATAAAPTAALLCNGLKMS